VKLSCFRDESVGLHSSVPQSDSDSGATRHIDFARPGPSSRAVPFQSAEHTLFAVFGEHANSSMLTTQSRKTGIFSGSLRIRFHISSEIVSQISNFGQPPDLSVAYLSGLCFPKERDATKNAAETHYSSTNRAAKSTLRLGAQCRQWIGVGLALELPPRWQPTVRVRAYRIFLLSVPYQNARRRPILQVQGDLCGSNGAA
jgi:hypothetical protein